MRALILSADQFEDVELLVPYYRLLEAGVGVDIASRRAGEITGKHGYRVRANMAAGDADPSEFDLLVLPGGKAPGAIRKVSGVQEIARTFMQSGKPVAAICHGAQILVSAEVVAGRTATAHPEVGPELRAAGADYRDEEVVVDGNLVTSRVPDDLPAFMREMMRLING